MHLCKCSLIFFLHHIYTAQTVKLLNVLISTPMAMKLFEIFRRCEKAGTQIKAVVARCSQRGRDVWSAPIVFVLGLGPTVQRIVCAGCQIPQPLHTAHADLTHSMGSVLWTRAGFDKMTLRSKHCSAWGQGCKVRHGESCSLFLLEGYFASICHLLKQKWGKFCSQHFQKFPSEAIKKKSSHLNKMKAFYGILVFF